MVLKRFVNGVEEDPFFQKRAPQNLPPGITTARIQFPSGRWADLVVCDEPADLAWAINLGCVDLNPWPVREDDVDHPDELRVDLDPTPEATFSDVKEVAMLVNELADRAGLRGYPKTSGSRGIHVNVRIEPKWEFSQVRRAALAIAREVEMRAPGLATAAWWKEERGTASSSTTTRTRATAPSPPPTRCARPPMPASPARLPGRSCPASTSATSRSRPSERFKQGIDPDAAIDEVYHSLEPLLELVKKHEGRASARAPTRRSSPRPRASRAASSPAAPARRTKSRRRRRCTPSDGPKALQRRRWPPAAEARQARRRPPPTMQSNRRPSFARRCCARRRCSSPRASSSPSFRVAASRTGS